MASSPELSTNIWNPCLTIVWSTNMFMECHWWALLPLLILILPKVLRYMFALWGLAMETFEIQTQAPSLWAWVHCNCNPSYSCESQSFLHLHLTCCIPDFPIYILKWIETYWSFLDVVILPFWIQPPLKKGVRVLWCINNACFHLFKYVLSKK